MRGELAALPRVYLLISPPLFPLFVLYWGTLVKAPPATS